MVKLFILMLSLLVDPGIAPWALLARAFWSLPDWVSKWLDVCDRWQSAALMSDDIMIVTTNDLPGFEVEEVYGEVFVRARNAFPNIGVGLRTIVGGEAKGYTKLLADSRTQAVDRLKDAARERGANAVIAMRFDCNEIGDIMSEVAAYGTAVRVRRVYAPPAPAA
jgi:uncharacterized protein YbjQ (UPF0145 family)